MAPTDKGERQSTVGVYERPPQMRRWLMVGVATAAALAAGLGVAALLLS